MVLTPETVDCEGILLIQGDSGTGKTTICNWIAPALGAKIFDTSKVFRGIAAYGLQAGISYFDELACQLFADRFEYFEQDDRSYVCGLDVTNELRTTETTEVVSEYAGVKCLREAYVQMTLNWVGGTRPAIVPGRHMQEVFPRALTLHIVRDLDESIRMRRKQSEDNNSSLIAPRNLKDSANALIAEVDLSSVTVLDVTGLSRPQQAKEALFLAQTAGFLVDWGRVGEGTWHMARS